MRVKIYRPARARLLEIWDYTEKRWGEGQADIYIRGLIKALEKAQGERYRWKPVSDEKLPDVFLSDISTITFSSGSSQISQWGSLASSMRA